MTSSALGPGTISAVTGAASGIARLTGTGYERFADVAARWGNVRR